MPTGLSKSRITGLGQSKNMKLYLKNLGIRLNTKGIKSIKIKIMRKCVLRACGS